MCSCCLVSHIRHEPEAETKDVAEASEAAVAAAAATAAGARWLTKAIAYNMRDHRPQHKQQRAKTSGLEKW